MLFAPQRSHQIWRAVVVPELQKERAPVHVLGVQLAQALERVDRDFRGREPDDGAITVVGALDELGFALGVLRVPQPEGGEGGGGVGGGEFAEGGEEGRVQDVSVK